MDDTGVMSDTVHVDQVGPYLLDEVVGRGSSGVVWRAYDEVSCECVAVKMLEEKMDQDPTARARFARECELVGAFSHPSLVRLRAAGRTETNINYLVMDLALGQTLLERWEDGPSMTVYDTIQVIVDIADALDAMHRAGWAHRDVKPANIVLDDNGRARLLDFGLTTRIGDTPKFTQAGFFVGTPIYLAPEQLLGARPAPTMDVYALGVMLYEAVSGHPPFLGDTEAILTQKSTQSAPEYHGSLPIADVLRATLTRRPEGRPQDAADFARRLRAALSSLKTLENEDVQLAPGQRMTDAETLTQTPTADLHVLGGDVNDDAWSSVDPFRSELVTQEPEMGEELQDRGRLSDIQFEAPVEAQAQDVVHVSTRVGHAPELSDPEFVTVDLQRRRLPRKAQQWVTSELQDPQIPLKNANKREGSKSAELLCRRVLEAYLPEGPSIVRTSPTVFLLAIVFSLIMAGGTWFVIELTRAVLRDFI